MTRDGTVVLLYHRVVELEHDPHGLAVSPRMFADQLRRLRRMTEILPLGQLSGGGARVVITFDDGYRDNATTAGDILAEAEAPATFFITAGRVGERTGFWWDRLARLLAGHVGRDHLDVCVNGRRVWVDVRSPAGRQRAHWALYHRLRPLPVTEIHELVDGVAGQLGGGDADEGGDAMMGDEDVRALAAERLFDVGAHTLTHPLLSAQPPGARHAEITGSRDRLRALTGQPVRSFAYPFGGRDAVDDVTVELVGEAGFEVACAGFGGAVWPGTNPLLLPRRVVGNWDGATLVQKVAGWRRDRG